MTEKKAPTPDKPVRKTGFLSCTRCSVAAPYQGFPDKPDTWPLHRCGFEVRSLDTWTDDDPRKMPLAPLETKDETAK
jgi:hypothetical protein